VSEAGPMDKAGLLYVHPSFPGRSAGIEAAWIAAASFASAVGARLGGTDVLSSNGNVELADLRSLAVRRTPQPSPARTVIRALPQPMGAVIAEVRAMRRARRIRNLASRMPPRPYELVMQLHRRYHDGGLVAARRARAPLVLRVEALEVREEASWGIRRPLWGGLAERLGEIRIVRKADLAAVVSSVLDAQLAEAGIEDSRRVVIPNGVDTEAFAPGERHLDLLRAHGLEDRFVIGWVGGFRPFHGLQSIPAIARGLRDRLPGAVLCLVGTGPTRDEIEERCRGLEDTVRFAGPVDHEDVPRWIRSFDACLLLAGSDEFHYSPLKLYEYLACGRPVVAARAGDVGLVIRDGRNGLLVPVGNSQAVVDSIVRLADDAALRGRLGMEGRHTAQRFGSWGSRAEALLAALDDRNLLPLAGRRQSTMRS
jgi:glycosyltransferase involved in cell wall biosynthesis